MRARLVSGLFGLCLVIGAVSAAELENGHAAALTKEIAQCWNTGALPGDAAKMVVTVRFELDRTARPIGDSLELVGAGKDTSQAVKNAYGAARRAILRCGAKGYKLPLEKYDTWRDISVTFNPERMQP